MPIFDVNPKNSPTIQIAIIIIVLNTRKIVKSCYVKLCNAKWSELK